MLHLTDLQLSMYADGALLASELAEHEAHLNGCAHCQARLQAQRGEVRQLSTTLLQDADLFERAIPSFKRPASLREFAIANIATVLVIWLAQFLWKTLFGELVMNAASWATSVYAPDTYELMTTAMLHYLKEGTAMLDAYLGFVVLGFATLTGAWLLLKFRTHRETASLAVLLLVGATFVAPEPAQALDFRRSDSTITVAAGETVDDTLLAAAETVLIKGTIKGDLVAVGNRVDIDGTIEGNLITFAESISIKGSIGGLVLGAGNTVELESARVAGDLWAAGEKLSVDDDSELARNALLASENAVVEATIGKDLYTFTELLELDGSVGEDLESFSERIRLLDGAHVQGDANLRLESSDQLERADGARIDGELTFSDLPEEIEPRNRYTQGEFYLWQLARIVSAVLAGLLLLWLVPYFRTVTIGSGVDGLKTAGIGLLALIGVPIAAVLIAITLIGLPVSAFAFVGWLAAIYLAKIVVGAFIGRALLSNTRFRDNTLLVLLAGITSIIVIVNIPMVGGLISFVLTIVGIGLIAQRLIAGNRNQDAATV